tara:strand:- start:982 stop:1203 length:222 start_codon:yes stop_codon:yes gene_type:complete
MMNMEQQIVFNFLLASGLAAAGWFLRSMWEAIREIEKDLPRNYIRREDYRDDMQEIKKMLGAIFDKLDDKADK